MCGGFTTTIPHLHEEALGLGGLASSHTLEGGILSCIHLHITKAGEMGRFRCQGTKPDMRKDLSSKETHSSTAENPSTPINPAGM